MSFINNVAPNFGGAPASSVLATAVAQAMGASGSNPTAKLLLPQAVVAPLVVPSYADVPRQAVKVPERLVTTQPSSGFAAQMLSQDEGMSTQVLSMLTPRPPQQQTPNAGAKPMQDAPFEPPVAAAVTGSAAQVQQQAAPQAPAQNVVLTATAFAPSVATGTVSQKPAKEETSSAKEEPVKLRERSSPESRGAAAYFSAFQRMNDRRDVPVEAVA